MKCTRNAGWIGETDNLLKIVRSKKLLSGLDISTDKLVRWPNIPCRETWRDQERWGGLGKTGIVTSQSGVEHDGCKTESNYCGIINGAAKT